MITSIVLTDTHNVGLDSHGKFVIGIKDAVDENKTKDVKVSIKDVPFVRYRFNSYSNEEIEYIKSMKEKFKYSSHMAEITIGEDTSDVIRKLDEIDNIIKFVYVPVNDEHVLNGLDEKTLELIGRASEEFYDRIMLKDCSTTLHSVAASRIKKQIIEVDEVDINDTDEIGICSSPLSFDGKNACLTAVKARELSAEYAENDEVALPSANHECMSCCGCIRYFVIDKDIEVKEVSKGKGGTSKKKSSTEGKSKSNSKKSKVKGFCKW